MARRAAAQNFPTRVVRLICPFPPGGATDVIARIMAGRLSQAWPQQVIVENKPGAGGNLGAEAAAHAEPDGHTLFIVSFGHAVNRFLYPSLGYDPVADFAPVTLICLQPNIMVVPVSSPAHSCAEFIAHARANRGKLSYASSGNGTSIHLCGALFNQLTGLELTHVPYRGSAPALNDLIPGRVDVMFDNITSSLPHVQAGTLRGLAVTTAKRVPAVPDLPPVADTVPGFDVSSWFALFLPARTPAAIVTKIHDDAVAVLADPAVKPQFEKLGAELVGSSPAELAAFLAAEMDKWGPIIKTANIRAE